MQNTQLSRAIVLLSYLFIALNVLIITNQSYKIFFDSNIYALASSIQDDSFYYIVPAFNASHGFGFSFGGELTYGFEPGYELLLTVVGFLANTTGELLRASLFLNSLLFVGTGVLIFLVVLRTSTLINKSGQNILTGYTASLVASFIYFSNYWNYFNSITAKENPLAALLLVTAIYLALKDCNSDCKRTPFFIGLIAGILILTRPVPSTALYILIFIWASRPQYKFVLSGILTVVLPWFVFAKIYFGSSIPFSALLKAAWPSITFTNSALVQAWEYLLTSIQFGVFGPSAVGLPQPNWQDAQRDLHLSYVLYFALFLCITALFMKLAKSNEISKKLFIIPLCLVAAAIGAALMGLALALKRPEEIFYASWYFYDSPAIVSIIVGNGSFVLLNWVEKSRKNVATSISIAVFLLISIGHIIALQNYRNFMPYSINDFNEGVGRRWGNTMIAAGLWYKEHIDNWHELRVAAIDAGALNFTLDDRVINLDGLANNSAARALLTINYDGLTNNRAAQVFLMLKTLQNKYIKDKRPNYFIDIGDIPFNTQVQKCPDF